MSEKMKDFVKAFAIELPQEIDSNPFEGLTADEVMRINTKLKEEEIY
ncbi:hypothetical protein [Labilibacter marinus]|nr:hypothetical protein [Labilibacter marinus]